MRTSIAILFIAAIVAGTMVQGCSDKPEKPVSQTITDTRVPSTMPMTATVFNQGQKQEYECNSIHIVQDAVHLIDNGCGLTIFPNQCDSINIKVLQ